MKTINFPLCALLLLLIALLLLPGCAQPLGPSGTATLTVDVRVGEAAEIPVAGMAVTLVRPDGSQDVRRTDVDGKVEWLVSFGEYTVSAYRMQLPYSMSGPVTRDARWVLLAR